MRPVNVIAARPHLDPALETGCSSRKSHGAGALHRYAQHTDVQRRKRSAKLLALLLWLSLFAALSLTAQAQKPQPGRSLPSTPCAHCHIAESLAQPETQMARAMQLRGSNPTLDAHPRLQFHLGKFTYSVETHAGLTQYTVSDGSGKISLPVLWTMGAEAQTWVLERNGIMYESLVSYYPVLQGLDITTGDERLHPATLDEAVGRALGDEDVKTCFGCHSTGAVGKNPILKNAAQDAIHDAIPDHGLDLKALQPGVTCAHCHTEAMAHLSRIVHGDDSVIPQDLGNLTSEDMSNFCGQCHRTWETVVRSHWTGSTNVRFQPYRLANSRCFDGNDPRIGCVACHNPHERVKRDAGYYDGKCLACHAPAVTASAANTIHAKACPVAKSACASCHMPKVPLPNGHLIFTDHQIRVVKPGESYPN